MSKKSNRIRKSKKVYLAATWVKIRANSWRLPSWIYQLRNANLALLSRCCWSWTSRAVTVDHRKVHSKRKLFLTNRTKLLMKSSRAAYRSCNWWWARKSCWRLTQKACTVTWGSSSINYKARYISSLLSKPSPSYNNRLSCKSWKSRRCRRTSWSRWKRCRKCSTILRLLRKPSRRQTWNRTGRALK